MTGSRQRRQSPDLARWSAFKTIRVLSPANLFTIVSDRGIPHDPFGHARTTHLPPEFARAQQRQSDATIPHTESDGVCRRESR